MEWQWWVGTGFTLWVERWTQRTPEASIFVIPQEYAMLIIVMPFAEDTFLLDLSLPKSDWTWVQKADMLNKRAIFGSAVYQGKIFVFGGYPLQNLDPSIDTIEVYDADGDTWQEIEEKNPQVGGSHAVQLEETKAWVLTGNFLRIFDLKSQRFLGQAGDLPKPPAPSMRKKIITIGLTSLQSHKTIPFKAMLW